MTIDFFTRPGKFKTMSELLFLWGFLHSMTSFCSLHRFFFAFVIFKFSSLSQPPPPLDFLHMHHITHSWYSNFFSFLLSSAGSNVLAEKMFKLTKINSNAMLLVSILVIVILPSSCMSTMLLDPLSPGEFCLCLPLITWNVRAINLNPSKRLKWLLLYVHHFHA